MFQQFLKLGWSAVKLQRTVIVRQGSTAVRNDFRAFRKMLRQDPILSVLLLGFTGLFGITHYSVSVYVIHVMCR